MNATTTSSSGRVRTLVAAMVVVITAVLLGAVPGQEPAGALSAADQDVYCRSYYRKSDSASLQKGTRITLADDGDSGRNRWEDLVFGAGMSSNPDGSAASVYVSVRQRGDEETLANGLYQSGRRGFVNAFGDTGQGFTGLLYVHDPNSPASLQFICKAIPEP